MEQRSKEDIIKSNEHIIEMIKSSPRVWVSTDFHYVKYDKKTGEIFVRKEYDAIIKALSVIKPDDTWIYLGDLIDSEVQKKSHLDIIKSAVSTDKRVLLLGNNDRYPSYDAWFAEVVNTILLPDEHVVLTHCPILNYEKVNIHGHIHVGEPGYEKAGMYWELYNVVPDNHVNAFTYPFKPVLLSKLIATKPSAHFQKATISAKPYTEQLVKNEIREYQILRAYYLKENND